MLYRIAILAALCGCAATPQSFDTGGQYLGAKYILDPLGEGVAPDTDPLIRTDAFDCTTFVETVMANGDVDRLTKIRYRDGVPGFLNRNHFIETDWLPNNANWVENVSAQYGKTKIRHVTTDKKSWLHTVHNIDADVPMQSADLEYIPYSALNEINNTDPLIVLFITGNCQKCAKIGTDVAVVHMGFLLPGGVLRHASSAHGVVMDTDFYKYIAQRKQTKNNIGIALVKIK
ncbi:MAG: DUF1460 domain-containing protein [Alphaproteobacteria bacterium]|nr:DUF1460 domain-containing protein [Alphaproteobacteria bacterium]